MELNKKPIVVTMGDPSGISAEIIFKTWMERKSIEPISFFVIDDIKRLEKIANFFKLKIPLQNVKKTSDVKNIFKHSLPVFSLGDNINAKLGEPKPENSKYIIKSIKKAVNFVSENKASSIVTSPLSKEILLDAGFKYLGQTEFISDLVKKKKGKKFEEIMILSTTKPSDGGENLRVGLITTHIPLIKVSKSISKNLIIRKTRSFVKTLQTKWKIKKPKVGICGLNPHSGENGLIGKEELSIIIPAINYLSDKKYNISGPISADTCFSKSRRVKYDGIICIYHDQGLIPVKTIDFFNSVNITGGIPIIRTSPDHGPAFDIAKLFKASNKSFIASLKLASKLSLK